MNFLREGFLKLSYRQTKIQTYRQIYPLRGW